MKELDIKPNKIIDLVLNIELKIDLNEEIAEEDLMKSAHEE